MKIYDASITVTPRMPIWPGNPGVELERVKSLEQGGSSNVSRLSLGVHTGTHVDAPVHFLPNGADVTALPLDVLTGEAYVVHLSDINAISAEVLERQPLPPGATRLLFRTRNSDLWARGDYEFTPDFVALTEDAARWVVDHEIRLVGIDYLSIQRYKDGADTHRILLGAGVVVVEGLNLAHIVPGRYEFYCLPLKLLGADGAPARAILVSRS